MDVVKSGPCEDQSHRGESRRVREVYFGLNACLFTMDSKTEILSTESISLAVIPTRAIVWSYQESIVFGTGSMRSKNRKPFVWPCRSYESHPISQTQARPSSQPRRYHLYFQETVLSCPDGIVPRSLSPGRPSNIFCMFPTAICSLYVLRDVQCMSVQSARNVRRGESL